MIKGEKKMEHNYGYRRVLEPKGAVPVTAWKVDNDRQLRPGEARINLELIHIEWDGFQQICTSCGYDDEKVKAKILYIIEKRGKLHNPFTGTGGIVLGTIDEVMPDNGYVPKTKPGDRVYCLSSLAGVPLFIENITGIDYNYGQISCTGYAIIFETVEIYKLDRGLPANYTLAAMDEAATLLGAYNIALNHECKNVCIIGRNAYTTLMYAAAVREAIGPTYRVIAVMDKYVRGSLSQDEIEKVLYPLAKEYYSLDLTNPVEAFDYLKKKEPIIGELDEVIVAEDIYGAETLAVMMVKSTGDLYFTAVENHYGTAQLVAESMAKPITMYAFDQYSTDYPDFTLQIIRNIQPKLDEVNKLYEGKKKISRVTKSRRKTVQLKKAGKEDDFIYQSEVTRNMVEEVLNVAKYDCNVIIQGETGVGKEKVLSLIHQNSDRRSYPCIKINCATIQESLAESEFFGYEAGAFTGAQSQGKPGYFELANNGILFLDEIGTLSMNMQSKLLRVLQESQFYRVGGTRQINVNVRVIVANNVPLKQLVDEGSFREDLYYRLNICTIEVPPLRDRRDDVICLAESFVAGWAKKYKVDKELSPGALSALHDYYWPGNVRELENVIHRLVISSSGVVITGEEVEELLNENAYGDMMLSVKKRFSGSDQMDFHQLMEQQEKQIIEYALKKEGTTRKAADLLGLPQTTFARKKIKHGL